MITIKPVTFYFLFFLRKCFFCLKSLQFFLAKSGMKGALSTVLLLSARANHWRKSIKKAPGHLRRLGNENDRERSVEVDRSTRGLNLVIGRVKTDIFGLDYFA